MELTILLIQSFLQPLFEDKKENCYIRWTNTQTEKLKKDEFYRFDKGPDGCITLETNQSINLCFTEIEEEKYQDREIKLNEDLDMLGISARNAIDQNYLLGALCI